MEDESHRTHKVMQRSSKVTATLVSCCCSAAVSVQPAKCCRQVLVSLCIFSGSFNSWAAGGGRGSCEPEPGWRCNGSVLGCTDPPPPAASSEEPPRKQQPCHSSAAHARTHTQDRRGGSMKRQPLAVKSRQTQKNANYQVQVLLTNTGEAETTSSARLQSAEWAWKREQGST